VGSFRRLAALAVLTVVVSLVAVGPAQATTTYFFSTTGSDSNDGLSESTPKQTASAFNSLVLGAGDTVKFKKGDVWSSTTAFLVSASEDGTSGARINLQSYGTGNQPKFTVGSSTQCWRLEGAYVNVDNLKAESCNYGFNVFGDHALLQNVHSDLNKSAGLKLSNSGSGHAQYSRVTQSSFEDNTQGAAQSIEGYGVLVNADDVEIDHNNFQRQSTGYGGSWHGSDVELFNASRVDIHHNWSEDSNGFSEVGRDTTGGDADTITYRYNRVHADCGDACSEAGGFNIRGADSQYGPNTNVTFEHNTVKVNGGTGEALVCSSGCPDSTVIRDNVFVHTNIASFIDDDGSAGWTETGNVFDGTTNPSGWTPHSSSAEGTMVFQTGTGNLRAASGSLAIDRGSSNFYGTDYYGTTVPQGSAPDSGYYELPV
jgi:hypothetical protein